MLDWLELVNLEIGNIVHHLIYVDNILQCTPESKRNLYKTMASVQDSVSVACTNYFQVSSSPSASSSNTLLTPYPNIILPPSSSNPTLSSP